MSENYRFKIHHGVRSLLLLLIAQLLSLPTVAQNQPLFPTLATFPVGAGQSIAAGDFNGDGQADLAAISLSSTSTTLTIFLDQGATTPPLSVATSLNLPAFAVSHLLAVDINNDKKLDLVVTTSTSVNVLAGNGDGTFQTPVSYSVSSAGNLTTVDLNGDGYSDLAIATTSTQTSANLIVLLNQGASNPGTLSAPVLYPTSLPVVTEVPQQIATGDFNGDGKPDIVVGDTQLTVFYGNGDGTLQAPSQATLAPVTPVLNGLYGDGLFVAADLNHDGVTDIAYLTSNFEDVYSVTLQVVLGHTNGKFTAGPSLPLITSLLYPTHMVSAGTTNGGDNVNLAIVTDKTTVLLGDGNGGFTQGQSYALNGNILPVPGSNGKIDLISEFTYTDPLSINPSSSSVTRLASNGDGTFQAIPTQFVQVFGFVPADLNGDGLTDILTFDYQGNIVTALGRGNGTFTVTSHVSGTSFDPDQSTPLVAADFTGDGITDLVTMTAGSGSPRADSNLIFYKGNGDGSFQTASTPVDLGIYGTTVAIAGDFNGDGANDIIVTAASQGFGLSFLPGKGDGTFGTSVPLPQVTSANFASPLLLSADLNSDHILDLIWEGKVFLGHGDGTFSLSNVPLPGGALAVGDLNGDGIADVVINTEFVGATVYAGNGDGTFQTSPFYTAALPPLAQGVVANITDSNGDDHPDLLLQYSLSTAAVTTNLAVFRGDGKGNFTADSNLYYAGAANPFQSGVNLFAFPARLNNQVSQQSKNPTLDYLTFSNGGATALLNQTNPAPTAPSRFSSKTALAASATAAAPAQQITLTATVTGIIPPTGTVSFTSGSTTLGTATLVNGVATLPISFPATGTYAVTANYPGDANNLPSSSSPVSVAVAPVASKTTLTVSSGNANPNQQLTFTATVTGSNPTGNVTFTSGSTTLGTASLTNGAASLPFAFTTAGTFTVTANYAGDAANLASVSTALTVTVAAPDFTVSASPTTATIAAGQSATTTLSIAPLGGYSGTVTFSCGTLPAGAACTFAPATATPASGATATTTLTITTTAPTTASLRQTSLPAIAFASMVFLTFSSRRLRGLNQRLKRTSLLTFLFFTGLLLLSGCSSSSPAKPTVMPGTPTGVQAITVTVADSVSKISHSLNFQLTVQ